MRDHLLSETMRLFCFCVLFSVTVINLCNFFSKVIVFEFSSKEIFCLHFYADLKLLMIHNNTVKISENLNKRNLLKICSQFIYPTNFCILCSHLTMRTVLFDLYKPLSRIKLFVHKYLIQNILY